MSHKIIQIAVSSNTYGTDSVFMLDENGEIWYKSDPKGGASRFYP